MWKAKEEQQPLCSESQYWVKQASQRSPSWDNMLDCIVVGQPPDTQQLWSFLSPGPGKGTGLWWRLLLPITQIYKVVGPVCLASPYVSVFFQGVRFFRLSPGSSAFLHFSWPCFPLVTLGPFLDGKETIFCRVLYQQPQTGQCLLFKIYQFCNTPNGSALLIKPWLPYL